MHFLIKGYLILQLPGPSGIPGFGVSQNPGILKLKSQNFSGYLLLCFRSLWTLFSPAPKIFSPTIPLFIDGKGTKTNIKVDQVGFVCFRLKGSEFKTKNEWINQWGRAANTIIQWNPFNWFAQVLGFKLICAQGTPSFCWSYDVPDICLPYSVQGNLPCFGRSTNMYSVRKGYFLLHLRPLMYLLSLQSNRTTILREKS